MVGKSVILKLCLWPHSFALLFLVGILIGWMGVIFYPEIDSLLSEGGQRVMILSWGLLCATGSTLDLPHHDPEAQSQSAPCRKNVRRFLSIAFVALMTYAFVFMTPSPEDQLKERPVTR